MVLNGLPTDRKMKWVPEGQRPVYEQYEEHAAWYAGDTNMLGNFYSSKINTPTANGRFWSETVQAKDNRTVVHVPIAGDIATFSADLLFSERPDIKIPEAHKRNDAGQVITNKRAVEAETRLGEIIDQGGVIERFLEAGETSSALGGVFLKPTWDREISSVPILTVAQPDNAIPVFKYGFLTGIIFHKVILKDKDKVYRLLEHYTKGYIVTGLYIGDEHTIGNKVPLTYMEATKDIIPIMETKIDDILARYVPNKRPHKRFRGSQLGMSDYQGTESLMDSLDMTMSSWMRDIALGRGRIHIAQDMLEVDGKGGARFDAGREAYVELDVDPSMMGDGTSPITATQFKIRTDDHRKTATEIATKIIHMAGYAPQSFGFNMDGNISTESHEIRERKTLITKQKKERFYKTAISDVLGMMLEIDNIHLENKTPTEFRPNVTFADTLGQDIGATARTVQMIDGARAASIQTRVAMLHPDWTPEQIDEETGRIKEEEGIGVESPVMVGGKAIE